MPPQHLAKKSRRHFVVLFIGFFGHQCDGGRSRADEKILADICRCRAIACVDFRQPFLHQTANASADNGVRRVALLDPIYGEMSSGWHGRDRLDIKGRRDCVLLSSRVQEVSVIFYRFATNPRRTGYIFSGSRAADVTLMNAAMSFSTGR